MLILVCNNPVFFQQITKIKIHSSFFFLKFLTKKSRCVLWAGKYGTILIIEDIHKKNLHASGQLLLSLIRQKFWVPDARNVLRKITLNF